MVDALSILIQPRRSDVLFWNSNSGIDPSAALPRTVHTCINR